MTPSSSSSKKLWSSSETMDEQQQQHTHRKVTLLYRIHHQRVPIPAGPPYIIYYNATTRGHHLQLQQHHCRINSYQHSLFHSDVYRYIMPSFSLELSTHILCRCVVGGTASTIQWLETWHGAVDSVVTSQPKAAWSG